MRILNDYSAKIKPPMAARKAVKPTLTEVEIAALLLFDALLVLLEVAPLSVAVADPVEPPEPLDGVAELELELEFRALDRKASKVLLLFALTAKTIPFVQ